MFYRDQFTYDLWRARRVGGGASVFDGIHDSVRLFDIYADTVRFWHAAGVVLEPDLIGSDEMDVWQDMAIDVLDAMGWTWSEAIAFMCNGDVARNAPALRMVA